MHLRSLIFAMSCCLSITNTYARPQEPYNPIMAQIYANQWVDNSWNIRNPAYIYFSKNCTNFVSQALRAGGWRNTSIGASNSDLYWYYVSSSQISDTWKVANALHRRFAFNYESWHGGLVQNPSVLRARVGDVIFADWEGISSSARIVNHAMIVTGTGSNGEPLVSYHSTDRENYPWSQFLANVKASGLSPLYYKYSPLNF